MLKKSRQRGAKRQAPEPAASTPPPKPTPEYAKLGTDAPIAWPAAGGRRVPVTGKLSPHAAEALKRMGITKE